MVLYNWPRDHPILYQFTLTCSVWMWSLYQVLFMYVALYLLYCTVASHLCSYLCGFYNLAHSVFPCNNRDFTGIFFYTTALQTIALFGLKLDRFPAAIGATTFFVVACSLMIPDKITWVRSMHLPILSLTPRLISSLSGMLNFAVFHTCKSFSPLKTTLLMTCSSPSIRSLHAGKRVFLPCSHALSNSI